MIDLNLDYDEAVILECDDVTRDTRNDMDLIGFVLTNRSLCCVYEKSNGFFKKRTNELCKLSLSDIKIMVLVKISGLDRQNAKLRLPTVFFFPS